MVKIGGTIAVTGWRVFGPVIEGIIASLPVVSETVDGEILPSSSFMTPSPILKVNLRLSALPPELAISILPLKSI